MDRPNRGSLRRYFPMQYVVPIALLLGSTFGCLLALLLHTTRVQDRMERAREIELVGNGMAAAARTVIHDLQNYGRWDDAVRHLTLNFDADWADENISVYLGVVQHYDHVLLLDGTGKAIYAFADHRRRAPPRDVAELLGPAVRAGMAQVQGASAANTPIVSGFTRLGDRLYVVSVAAVMPLTDRIARPPGPPLTLVLAKRVDAAFLAELAAAHHAPALQLATVPMAGATAIPLMALDGQRAGWIAWRSHQPGSALRRDVLPGFAVVALIALIAAGLILFRARKGVEALRGSEAQANYQALHDPLTGLGNRRAMMERLAETRGPFILFYMDLDGFKETNDVYGHAAGDELLVEAARRIAGAAISAGADMVARSGGDEFAVTVSGWSQEDAAKLAETILQAFQAPFAVGGYSVSAGISIGIAESGPGSGADELIRRADVAMYVAKANGKDCFSTYHRSMDQEHDERRRLENDLRHAIVGGHINVVFQPIVDAAGSHVAGVEALARWTHPRHGPISPETFVRVAERSGLINDLGRYVLVTACREAIGWNVDLAVNLSPAQFWDRTLVCRIGEALRETGFPANRLELEITESYLLRRPDAAEEILLQLRALGIRIALDDFGTGFASIGYLQKLSFDRIKIDRSFVTHVAEDSRAADMARAMVLLAEALDLPVTAEGIETEAQATIMRLIGCTRLQGWLFGRPMASAAMTAWLAEPRAATA
jgi:diguanylate cyclase (GGDEF)-like protein